MEVADAGEEVRYRLLETLREYGWERLVELGEAEGVRTRHREYLQRLAERAEPELADEVAATLARKGWERDRDHRGAYTFIATGDVDAFREEGTRFLQLPIGDVEHMSVG